MRRDTPREDTTARPAVLIVAPTRDLTFVDQDVRILAVEYAVDVIARIDYVSPRALLLAIARKLLTKRHALVFVWFAEPYDSPFIVILARLLRVKCAIVVGGYEMASIPAIGYGSLSTPSERRRVKVALRGADLILPTSRLLENEVRLLARTRRLRVIHPGVDCSRFSPGGSAREQLVITVGSVADETWRLKGLDVFATCSRILPDVRFAILGPCPAAHIATELRRLGGSNLFLSERRLNSDELLSWYRRARVCVQLSARESFGLALAEAMASGCVPVATTAGALPEVVGDAGFLIDYGDVRAATRAIQRALESDIGEHARQRIMSLFPLEKREHQLRRVLAGLIGRASEP